MITFEKLQLVKEMIKNTSGSLLDYIFFSKCYKMMTIDLSKQQVLDADPKAIQQINFTGNLNRQNAGGQNINVNTTKLLVNEAARYWSGFKTFIKCCWWFLWSNYFSS